MSDDTVKLIAVAVLVVPTLLFYAVGWWLCSRGASSTPRERGRG